MRYSWGFLLLSCLLAQTIQAQQLADLQHTWVGKLQFGTTAYPVRLRFPNATGPDALPVIDLPQQGAQSVRVDYVRQQGDSLHFAVSGHASHYTAKLTRNPDQLTGIWRLRGAKIPLTLRPLSPDSLALLRRPQEPTWPLPYEQTPVTFAGGAPGIALKGTITAPKARKRHPGIVLLSGSGPHDRDGLAFDHKPFLVLADYLTRRGYVVLRYDERGVGESTGQFGRARTKDFALDATAAVQALRHNPRVHKQQVFVLGHSQGSYETAIVAAADPAIAGVIQLAGVGTSGLDLLQMNYRAKLGKLNLPAPPEEQPYIEAIMAAAAATPDSAAAVAQMRQKLRALTSDSEEIAQAIAYFAPTYLDHTTHDILGFDPTPYLKAIRVPMLAITGEQDEQAPAQSQHAAFAASLPHGNSGQLTRIVLPNLNHFLQTTKADNTTGYGESYKLQETIAPGVLEAIATWLDQQKKR